MSKIFRKAYLYALFLCISLGALVFCLCSNSSVSAEDKVRFDDVEIAETATLGEEIDFPEIDVTVNGNKVRANCYIYKPDGDVYAGNAVVCDVTGRYRVEYSVICDNVKYKCEKYIEVSDECFSLSDDKSTIYFGENKTYSGVNGLNVQLSTGGKLLYNVPIDMEGKTQENELVSFTLTPQIKGESDAKFLFFVLQDIYNPDNNIKIQIYNEKDQNAYILTSGNEGKDKYGLRPTNDAADTVYNYNGQRYRLYKNSWGTFTPVSFACNHYEVGEEILSFSMDYEEKQLFFKTSKKTGRYLVFDFDDRSLSDINFSGFESGKAFLYVYADELSGSTANIVLKTIDGTELSKKPCSAVESEIRINAPETIPHAVVGSTYPCFDAKAYVATNNSGELYTSVFYSYYSQARSEVPVIDGRFTVAYEGLYTIEYMVKDKFGNRTIETVDIQAVKCDKLNATVLPDTAEHSAGVENIVPSLNVNSSYGDDRIEIKIFGRFGEGGEFEIENYRFVPDKVGEYTIKYRITDFADTIFVEHKINVDNNVVPIFLNDPVYDEYIIANARYKVIPMLAAVYKDGRKVDIDVVTEINCLNEQKEIIKAESIQNGTFAVNGCDFVEIAYKATFEGNTDVYSVIRPVIGVGYGDKLSMEKYFVDKTGTSFRESKKLELKFTYTPENVSGGVGRLQFARDIVADSFETTFGKISSENVKLNIYLRDRRDTEEQVKLTYYVLADNIVNFLINDELCTVYNKNLLTNLTTLTYDGYEKKVVLDAIQFYNVKTYMNGKEFTGFSSNYVYMEIEIEGVEKDVSFCVGSICNQVFGNYKYDAVKPYYSLAKNTGLQLVNSTYTIEPTYFSDVLDPNITYSMNVYMPDKSIARTVDGIELKNVTDTSRAYDIVLGTYGNYSVYFTATDFSGNCHEQVGYSVRVTDTVAPVITVTDNVTKGKVGRAIEFPEITVKDDVDGEDGLSVFVCVYSPSGAVSKWDAGTALILDEAGKYTVQVFCYDSSGNTTCYGYTLMLEE